MWAVGDNFSAVSVASPEVPSQSSEPSVLVTETPSAETGTGTGELTEGEGGGAREGGREEGGGAIVE